jgi:FMN phosphatase YigB (HAD superfamily)
MSLSLEQYVTYLDRQGTPWPAPPEVERPRARAHLTRLPDVRAVTWNVYGTLLAIAGGEMCFVHPQQLIMDLALEKTIQEFKMWGSMTRKPGQPAEYLRPLYVTVLHQLQTDHRRAEKYTELSVDRLWEALIKKLLQKDYKFDAGFYGSLNEFSAKVAYFFHASLQGVACYPGAARALRHIKEGGLAQGLLGNGQCFTPPQLRRCLGRQEAGADGAELIDPRHCTLSYEVRARQPSDKLFRQALAGFAERGIKPDQVLHVGSRVSLDVVPARRLGMRTGLFAGDKASLEANNKQLESPMSRPDVLLTELTQIAEVVG